MERRTRTKLLRFTPAELERIAERARACGKPAAVYIREVALGAAPRARPAHLEQQVVHQLGQIGAALHQLAHAADRSGERAMREALDALRDQLVAAARRLE